MKKNHYLLLVVDLQVERSEIPVPFLLSICFLWIALLVDYAVFSMVGFIGISIMMLFLHFSDKQ